MNYQQNIWDKVKESIKEKLNDHAFARWIQPIKLKNFSGDTLTLEVPDKFFQDWISERYLDLIKDAAQRIADKKVEIGFSFQNDKTIESSPPPAVVFKKESPAAQELGFNPKYTFEDFVVGPSNRFVHAASLAVCESPAKSYNPLFIYGGVGLGKTHLMQAIGRYITQRFPKMKALYISGENFTNQLISAIQNRTAVKFRQKYRNNVDVLLIDDIHFIAGKESTQEEFFHTFNTLYDAHKQIVVSSDRFPKDITSLEERLVSRFEWGLITDVQPPDLETRIAILRKKAERETILVPNDVTFLIAERIKSNIRELEGALIRVVAYAKLMGTQITASLVKEVLKDMFLEEETKVSIDLIQKRVAEYFNIRLLDMKGRKRNRAIAYPRQVAIYLARELTDYSLPDLGGFFGGRDHTTILHACEKIQKELKQNKSVKNLINRLVSEVKG